MKLRGSKVLSLRDWIASILLEFACYDFGSQYHLKGLKFVQEVLP